MLMVAAMAGISMAGTVATTVVMLPLTMVLTGVVHTVTVVTVTGMVVMATWMGGLITGADIEAMAVGMLEVAGIQATVNTVAALRDEDMVPELS